MIPIVQIPRVKRVSYQGLKTKVGATDIPANTLQGLLPHTPEWALEHFKPARFHAAFGGRASGKSHAFAERMLARMLLDPSLQCVVIRKYRASLTNSVQLLLKLKVAALRWDAFFDCQGNQIKRIGGNGFIAFTGIQDHNATSIKSFESFGIAWIEEATEIDQYSFDLIEPTIRSKGSQLWITWNPDQPTDPVDAFFRINPPENAVVSNVSFKDNPFLTEESKRSEQAMLERDPEKHAWVWLGGYNVKSDAIIFAGKWRVGTFDITGWDGPYYGADWGFAVDPTVAVELWLQGSIVYVRRESYHYRLTQDLIASTWIKDIPGIEKYASIGDNSRPETINHVKAKGIPRIRPCTKWKGSVEDGIEWLKSRDIVIDPSCTNTTEEFRRYRYKQNKAGEVLPDIVDKDQHAIDSIRYALEKLIQKKGKYQEIRAIW